MNEMDNHTGDQQNPEVLKKQIETISRTASNTLDKQANVIGRFFPDAAEKLRERQKEAILEEHFDYNIKAMRTFKANQLKALESFLSNNLERVIADEALKTNVSHNRNFELATRSYMSTVFKVNEMYDEFLNQVQGLKDEKRIQRIEEQLDRAVTQILALAERKFTEYQEKLG